MSQQLKHGGTVMVSTRHGEPGADGPAKAHSGVKFEQVGCGPRNNTASSFLNFPTSQHLGLRRIWVSRLSRYVSLKLFN